ncbi:MAG: hypothetical protein WCK42_09780 [Myxococcaceae bacterium]
MKETNLFILTKLELDRRLYNELKCLGVVQSQSELGKLCGKKESYFACMRNRGFGLQLGSLAFLANRLESQVEKEHNAERAFKIRQAVSLVRQTLNERCRLREIELGNH